LRGSGLHKLWEFPIRKSESYGLLTWVVSGRPVFSIGIPGARNWILEQEVLERNPYFLYLFSKSVRQCKFSFFSSLSLSLSWQLLKPTTVLLCNNTRSRDMHEIRRDGRLVFRATRGFSARRIALVCHLSSSNTSSLLIYLYFVGKEEDGGRGQGGEEVPSSVYSKSSARPGYWDDRPSHPAGQTCQDQQEPILPRQTR
jgi:hypothetical protein